MTDANYATYGAWKDWQSDDFMRIADWERSYYTDELRDVQLAGRDVLEIGFGNGSFLRWAKDEGARLFGTEVLPEALAHAEQTGVTTLPLDLAESVPDYAGRFALIAAFDVMEHLSYAENQRLLDQVAALLAPGGRFVARFPNGQSPFGRVYQNGDMTHSCMLSASIVRQLLIGRPFDVIHLGNPAAVRASGTVRRLGSHARHVLQKTTERFIAYLYGFTVPLGPNTVMLLRRT